MVVCRARIHLRISVSWRSWTEAWYQHVGVLLPMCTSLRTTAYLWVGSNMRNLPGSCGVS